MKVRGWKGLLIKGSGKKWILPYIVVFFQD